MKHKPKVLKKGDLIAIAAPSSPCDHAAFLEGVGILKDMGFQVTYREDILSRERYLAGNDDRRFDELKEHLVNPDVKAILFARGGYGFMRLLPRFQSENLKLQSKVILGYSDLTSALLYFMQNYGWPVFYGPVVAKDLSASTPQATISSLSNALTQAQPLGPIVAQDALCVQSGTAEGVLTGGCLTLVCASLGTPFEINTDNKILFLEDTNEKPYSIDRLLTQLELAGKFKKLKGLLLGNFVHETLGDYIYEVVEEICGRYQIPILYDFPAGHGPIKLTLPLGLKVRLSAEDKKIEYLESAFDNK